MMGTGKRRSNAQIARDRRRIANLYLQGWLQADIAAEVELSQATISRDLAALQGEWLTSALVDFDEAKARELAKIDRLEREYWGAWQRSCEDAETITEKGKGSKEQVKDFEKTVQRKGQAGDPRFLQGVEWCIERRCKILGIDKPARAQNLNLNLAELTDEQLRRIADGEDPLRVLYDTRTSTSDTGVTEAG